MNEGLVERPLSYTRAIALWHVLLRDEDALLKCPGAHHKALLSQAHALHRDQVISSADLGDLLEQADGALAYAVETLMDYQNDDLGD
ncbi:hypothetical protein SAMN05421862_12285 [Pseudomonas extremaustralis]|uniref:hypothetical protein n=1 Tax=Pseudomonas extremaustralis TaxID=359110 RepID=UPI00099C670A|nr:hypothetical protein [Pseudomonas extremaustralis]SKB04052.1 hypothetical protein SAMN05421862_12285 [Pseudomonas extremaustralis]